MFPLSSAKNSKRLIERLAFFIFDKDGTLTSTPKIIVINGMV